MNMLSNFLETANRIPENKFKENTLKMQKDNHLMLGFANFGDFLQSLLGLKNTLLNFIFGFLAVLPTFISSYIYDDYKAVYFMYTLVIIDASTGILRAFKNKTFSSSRLPRIFVITLCYTVMLAMSWNAAKFSSMFLYLPGFIYGGLIATLLISVFENFMLLGLINKQIYFSIKNKLLGFFKEEEKKNSKKKKED